jgi:DNA repair protein RadC
MSSKKVSPQSQAVISSSASHLSDETIVAALLKGTTGKRAAVDVARDILRYVDGDLLRLVDAAYVSEIDGFSLDGHARILAASEIVRRSIHRSVVRQRKPVSTPEAIFDYAASLALGREESLVGIFLDRNLVPISTKVLTKGSSEFTVVDPSQIARIAISYGAKSVVMVHNHPSGNLSPSSQDLDVTRRTASVLRVVGIPLVDHVIIVSGGFTSLAQLGHL